MSKYHFKMQVITSMVELAHPGGIHEHTLLVILSDHGQTMSGDHGGGSREEIDAVLLAVNLAAAAQMVISEGSGEEMRRRLVHRETKELVVVEQLDFAATLSALLGLHFPFENVGMYPYQISNSVRSLGLLQLPFYITGVTVGYSLLELEAE
jgi:GPI ethanolamine phosphate transferase 3 subunit O